MVCRGKELNGNLLLVHLEAFEMEEGYETFFEKGDTLTSAILLHEDLVGKAIYTFQLPEKIAAMDKIADRSLLDRFTGAADFLGVSKSAFAIRLKQLGILDRNYPHSQYSLVDVFDDEEDV